jgi:hypothetical protein
MTIPTAEKTWTCRHTTVNSGVALTNQKQAWFEIKEAMVSAGATVIRSSDGTNASDSDLWTDATKIVSGASFSWCVIRFTSIGPTYFDVLLAPLKSSSLYRYLYISPTGYSGGTISVLPTATIEIKLIDGVSSYFFTPNSTVKNILHSQWASDGSAFRLISCNSNLAVAGFGFEKLKISSASVPLTDQWVIWSKITANANANVLTKANLFTAAAAYQYSTSAAAVYTTYLTGEAVNASSTITLVAEQASANPLDGSSWPMGAIGIYSEGSSDYRFGRDALIYDMYWVNSTKAVGSTYGSQTWAQFGMLAIPWDGTMPEVS